jgi:spore coat protein CotF
MFNRHAADEQRHYDTINEMLQGQTPTMAQQQNASGQQGMQQNAGQSQAQQNTPQQPLANSQPQTTGQAMANQDDCTLCTDLLATEKHVSSTYDTAVFESANPIVRQTIQHIQKEEQQHGEEIFNYMNSHGMYNLS